MTAILSPYGLDAGKSPEQLCAARSKRLHDAIQLKQPDRIPIQVGFGHMIAELTGATRQELFENPEKMREALVERRTAFSAGQRVGDVRRSVAWPGYWETVLPGGRGTAWKRMVRSRWSKTST